MSRTMRLHRFSFRCTACRAPTSTSCSHAAHLVLLVEKDDRGGPEWHRLQVLRAGRRALLRTLCSVHLQVDPLSGVKAGHYSVLKTGRKPKAESPPTPALERDGIVVFPAVAALQRATRRASRAGGTHECERAPDGSARESAPGKPRRGYSAPVVAGERRAALEQRRLAADDGVYSTSNFLAALT